MNNIQPDSISLSGMANNNESLEFEFSAQDIVQMKNHGVSLDTVKRQLTIFKNGVSKTILDRPAAISDGIILLSEEEQQHFANLFEVKKSSIKLMKFVPASGAASRMFAFLSEFVNEFKVGEETINAYINRKNAAVLAVFLVGTDKFSFFKQIRKELRDNLPEYRKMDKDLRTYHFVKTLLSSPKFNFVNKPKGVLPFHKYEDHIATPVEEQLNEGIALTGSDADSFLHFTISEDHQTHFEKIIAEVKPKLEQEKGNKINVDFSYQKKSTDSIAVDLDNQPFRNDKGELVFRPAGHGALIENLNDLDADIVFIKNIDNVIQNHIETISHYKKLLAGILLELQQQVFGYLEIIDYQNVSENKISEIIAFAEDKLGIKIPADFFKYTLENQIITIREILDRPIRVCGMVKNEGEAGGGPFWVLGNEGNLSLQIVETSQIDIENPSQLAILQQSTHFNPVDLVCGIKNYKGEKFDLRNFVDPDAGFIVEKTNGGRKLKSYELPGLWNGAMANWITIFVEVPLITFNPVKTVNDLLKPAHQPQ